MIFENRAGPSFSSDGQTGPNRSGKTGELSIVDAHAGGFEATSRGRTFFAANQTAKNAGASNGTGTFDIILLFNPAQSGVVLSIIEFTIGIATDLTVPATSNQAIFWASGFTTSFVTGAFGGPPARLAAHNCLLGGPASAVEVYSLAGYSGSVSTICMIGETSITLATSSVGVYANLYSIIRPINGKIIVRPNTGVGIQTASITTSIDCIASVMWEEVPLF